MDIKQVQSEIESLRTELSKVPQIEARLNRLMGMEEILLMQEEESKKPDLKVASSDATG